jgi:hypothetical protein
MWAPTASLRLPATLDRLRAAARAIERHRRVVLAGIVVAQFAGVAAVALTARHDGWLYYHGGDGIWYWTTAWALGHFTVPFSQIGFGLGTLQAIGGAFLGPSMLSGLPFVVLLNVLVFLPLVPLLLYGIGERIAGRLFGLLVAALWLVVPLLAYRMFRPDYRGLQFLDQFLPGAVGLNALADFPSLVICLAVVYFALRAMDNAGTTDAVLAGALAGFLLAVKPSNALLLPAPVLGLLLARRYPQAAGFVLALVPAVVALAVWKERGLGSLPLFSAPDELRLASASGPLAALPDLTRYGGFHWSAIQENLSQLREIFWSKTLLEWTAIAGTFALLRRSFAKGAVVVVWFALYFLLKGGTQYASVFAGSFFRLLEPAYPAFLLFVAACVALLVPGVRTRVPAAPRPVGRRVPAVALVVLGLVPLVLVAAARPAASGSFAQFAGDSVDVRIVDMALTARTSTGAVRLSWHPQTAATASVGYRVFRARTPNDDCNTLANGARDCIVRSKPIANVSGTTFVDHPGPGTWYYRVAQVASWDGKLENGDPLLLSRPATARIP